MLADFVAANAGVLRNTYEEAKGTEITIAVNVISIPPPASDKYGRPPYHFTESCDTNDASTFCISIRAPTERLLLDE